MVAGTVVAGEPGVVTVVEKTPLGTSAARVERVALDSVVVVVVLEDAVGVAFSVGDVPVAVPGKVEGAADVVAEGLASLDELVAGGPAPPPPGLDAYV